jgi:Family of unknown function (DUF5677)
VRIRNAWAKNDSSAKTSDVFGGPLVGISVGVFSTRLLRRKRRALVKTNETAEQLIFGFQIEWQDFHKRNALFLERFPHLKAALDTAFLRTAYFSEPIDKFLFMFGRLCCEDFFEILLCCGNGYGQAATKLLRGLYERGVTLLYLQEHPEYVDDFLDFHHISQRKLLLSINETMGKGTISEEMSDRVEKQYQETKEKFMITHCEKCGTKRLNHTWSKLDFVAMAKKTPLGQLIVPGYYLPLRQAHSTVGSLLSRLEETDGGGIGFDPSAQREAADDALMTSYNIMLAVLNVQVERFKIPNLEEQVEVCGKDLMDVLKDQIEARDEERDTNPNSHRS